MKKLLYLFLLLIAFAISACSEDYLDEPKPTDTVTETIVFSSKEAALAHISGMMRLSRAQFTNNDSAGLNSYYYARSVKGNDVVQGPTWFTFDYGHENREPTYRRTVFSWDFAYYMIYQANAMISGIDESSLSDEDKNEILSQALAIRGFYYFQLALEFQETYAIGKDKPSLPIYTAVTTEGKGLSTLQEVYDLILSDLTTAREIGSTSRLDKSYINTNVINGMLSRVYLTMDNWQGAADAANAAREGFPLDAAGYANGFNSLEGNSEWIWGMPQSLDQSNYYWGAPHSHADHYTLSYQGTFFNNTFVNKFTDTDVRNLFVEGYNVPETDYRNFITTKFTFTFDADHPIMRSAEMILTEAEAMVRLGNDVEGQNLLFQVQSNRDPQAAVKTASTGDALIEEILLERRKDLYAEVGIEWFDAKRLQRGIYRDGNHRVFIDVEPNSNLFVLKLPQKEIDANDLIDASINNGR